MIIKTLIISVVVVVLFMFAFGIKLLFKRNAELPSPSCALEEGKEISKDEACSKCELKDLVNCPEKAKESN